METKLDMICKVAVCFEKCFKCNEILQECECGIFPFVYMCIYNFILFYWDSDLAGI